MHVSAPRFVGDVVILDLEGKILICSNDDSLRDTVATLADEGWRKVVLNIAGVPYLDSAGLGEFVRAYTIVGRKEGKLKLLNPQRQLRDALEQTKLASVFEIYGAEEDAVKSFADPEKQADLARRSAQSHPARLETAIP